MKKESKIIKQKKSIKRKIGDKLTLNGNPFDEQLGEYGAYGEHVVIEVQEVPHGYWVKTDKHPDDWIDSAWFLPLPLSDEKKEK